MLQLLTYIALAISMAGIVVTIWGSLLVIFSFLYLEYKILNNHVAEDIEKVGTHILRQRLGSYILLGMEFMIAGDIIQTVLKPDKEGLIILASIVSIRTVISFFLTRELKSDL